MPPQTKQKKLQPLVDKQKRAKRNFNSMYHTQQKDELETASEVYFNELMIPNSADIDSQIINEYHQIEKFHAEIEACEQKRQFIEYEKEFQRT